jgi:hypothetical protein
MALKSKLFGGDPAFEACATKDAAHIKPGAKGAHVSKIHTALFALDDFSVAPAELNTATYGPTTAKGVLKYKQVRKIVNHAYQTAADNIVGKMTIAAMDKEMAKSENVPELTDPRLASWTTRRT